MDWFLYDNGLRHERAKVELTNCKEHIRTLYTLYTLTLSLHLHTLSKYSQNTHYIHEP